MKLDLLFGALAAASLLATSPGFGHTWASEPWLRALPRGCTPEAQKCLEKLEMRLQPHGHSPDQGLLENALLELLETDPECAALLRSAAAQAR